MERKYLAADSIPSLLETLRLFGELHGPTRSPDGVYTFAPIASPDALHLDYRRTLLPPKKYLLPPREIALICSSGRYSQPSQDLQRKILFGLHPCDLAGIAYLDHVFLAPDPDPLYRARRRHLILVGISCDPDDYCFCGEVAIGVPAHYDLFLERKGEGFAVSSGSKSGMKILAKISPLLKKTELPAPTLKNSTVFATIISASRRSETFPESGLWDEFAARCLSCGACSLCCPTCYCFDIREDGNLDGKTANRLREWDNCLFKEHAEVSGGFNFRKGRRERFLYRFQHKYLGFGPTRGTVACVGCGRCREVCPVKIDLLELFREQR